MQDERKISEAESQSLHNALPASCDEVIEPVAMQDETEASGARISRCSGEAQIAAELRDIAKETECGQRQMHLEIAAQIVEQGQFLHPDNFGLSIENDELRAQLAEVLAERDAARLEIQARPLFSTRKVMAERDVLQAKLQTAVGALEKARAQFQFYAEEHDAKAEAAKQAYDSTHFWESTAEEQAAKAEWQKRATQAQTNHDFANMLAGALAAIRDGAKVDAMAAPIADHLVTPSPVDDGEPVPGDHQALAGALTEATAALKPFADCCDQISDDESDEEWAKFRLLVKDYRRASAALAKLEA